ncbi:MAG: helix-turn-helix transcriptional regulator [Burkholderiales bacterium]|nr:helix-turn-helix transcriptional regulator [Burkholderiales bacterium]
MKDVLTVARTLQESMKVARLTYKDVADRTGLSYLAVRNVMQGKSAARLSTLIAVANAVGLEVVLLPKLVAQSLTIDPTQSAPRPLSLVEQLVAKDRAGQ